MMLCKPKSFFSGDFVLEGEGHHAALAFNWLTEQGSILADRSLFEVRKHGIVNARWTIEREGRELATAHKASVFKRTFEIQRAGASLLLRADSPMGRRFILEQDGAMLMTIAPRHIFSRHMDVDIGQSTLDFPTIAFAQWLVALTWRREAQSG